MDRLEYSREDDTRELGTRFDPLYILPLKLTVSPCGKTEQKVKVFDKDDYGMSSNHYVKKVEKVRNVDLELYPSRMMKDGSLVYMWGEHGNKPRNFRFIPNSKYYNEQIPVFEHKK